MYIKYTVEVLISTHITCNNLCTEKYTKQLNAIYFAIVDCNTLQ